MKPTREEALRCLNLFRDADGELCARKQDVVRKIIINTDCSEDEADAVITQLARKGLVEICLANVDIYLCDPA